MASKGNAAVAPEPKSPTSQRRFSLGKGNDGEGNPMYKVLDCPICNKLIALELAEET